MQAQGEFTFEAGPDQDGYALWLAGRKQVALELAHRVNLPLGHRVEVWLRGGIRLRGTLSLREEQLLIEEDHLRHLEFKVDDVPFAYREIDSCVRLD